MRVERVQIDKQNKKTIQGSFVRVYWEDLSLNLIIQVSDGTTLLNAYLTAHDVAHSLKKRGSLIWKEERPTKNERRRS